MDFRRLKYFCALVEKGSFSKAARSVFMSQPPFSQRIRELENSVGVELVHRNGKSFQITPAGWEFYRKAQFILSHLNGLITDFQKSASTKTTRLRIGICPLSLSMYLNSLCELQELFPHVSYRIWVMDNQALENAMQETQLDFCFLQLPLNYANYKMLRLKSASFVAVYGNGIPVPDHKILEIGDLKDVPLLLSRRRDGEGAFEQLMREFQYAGIEPDILMDTQRCRLLVTMLMTGAKGVAILPRDEIPDICKLPVRELGFVNLQTCPVLVTLKNGYLSPAAFEVLRFFFLKYHDECESAESLERHFENPQGKTR